MKHMHVHVAVKNLDESIRFYSALFGSDPIVRKADYAKWRVDDMNVNFAITMRDTDHGVDHLGIQVDTDAELQESEARMHAAGRPAIDSDDVHCCYARVTQAWTIDPQGVLWETFRTTGQSELYCDGGDPVQALRERASTT